VETIQKASQYSFQTLSTHNTFKKKKETHLVSSDEMQRMKQTYKITKSCSDIILGRCGTSLSRRTSHAFRDSGAKTITHDGKRDQVESSEKKNLLKGQASYAWYARGFPVFYRFLSQVKDPMVGISDIEPS